MPEAMAEPICVYPASRPTEAPTPRLQADDDAVGERHPAAEKGIGLDGVDRPPWPPTRQRKAGEPHRETAEGRHQQQTGDRDFGGRTQPAADRNEEQRLMHELDGAVHRHHHDAGTDTDERGQHRQPDLVRTNQRPQRLRHMQNPVADQLSAALARQGAGGHRPGVPPTPQRARRPNRDGAAGNS
jgi:hypothetical protein